MKLAHLAPFVALVGSVSACAGRTLDLGNDHDGPGGRAGNPPLTADGSVDETTPWKIVPDLAGVQALAADDSRLYWITAGTVQSCVPFDCARTRVTYYTANLPLANAALVVADGRVYWESVRDGSQLLSCDVSGCNGRPNVVVSGPDFNPQGAALELLVDDTHIYWRTLYTQLERCERQRCSDTHEKVVVTDLLPDGTGAPDPDGVTGIADPDPDGLTGDAENLYYYVGNNIYAKSKSGPAAPTVVASGLLHPASLAARGGDIYWTEDYSQGRVARCPGSGCTGAPEVLANKQVNPKHLVLDDQNMYFVSFGSPELGTGMGGIIVECPLDGCGTKPKALATGIDTSGLMLVVDSTHVYYADGNDAHGNIYRIGK
jgi:hypothetical protein